jgi:hypothetical protein
MALKVPYFLTCHSTKLFWHYIIYPFCFDTPEVHTVAMLVLLVVGNNMCESGIASVGFSL